MQELIDAEASAKIGAERGEHTDTRTRSVDDLVKALGSDTGISKNAAPT
ncbi:transposase [Streptomyces sp. ICN988]|nr:transposase [Streptomyces sp. ICN988]MCV2459404.1 transposase [Streptomyces sp. ICN988]